MQLKFPKHIKKFRKRSMYASPGIFWQVLLLFAGLMVTASFVFGYLLFQRVNKELVVSNKAINTNSQIIPKERIDSALKYFSDRQNKSDEILNSSSPVVDPSL